MRIQLAFGPIVNHESRSSMYLDFFGLLFLLSFLIRLFHCLTWNRKGMILLRNYCTICICMYWVWLLNKISCSKVALALKSLFGFNQLIKREVAFLLSSKNSENLNFSTVHSRKIQFFGIFAG